MILKVTDGDLSVLTLTFVMTYLISNWPVIGWLLFAYAGVTLVVYVLEALDTT